MIPYYFPLSLSLSLLYFLLCFFSHVGHTSIDRCFCFSVVDMMSNDFRCVLYAFLHFSSEKSTVHSTFGKTGANLEPTQIRWDLKLGFFFLTAVRCTHMSIFTIFCERKNALLHIKLCPGGTTGKGANCLQKFATVALQTQQLTKTLLLRMPLVSNHATFLSANVRN